MVDEERNNCREEEGGGGGGENVGREEATNLKGNRPKIRRAEGDTRRFLRIQAFSLWIT